MNSCEAPQAIEEGYVFHISFGTNISDAGSFVEKLSVTKPFCLKYNAGQTRLFLFASFFFAMRLQRKSGPGVFCVKDRSGYPLSIKD